MLWYVLVSKLKIYLKVYGNLVTIFAVGCNIAWTDTPPLNNYCVSLLCAADLKCFELTFCIFGATGRETVRCGSGNECWEWGLRLRDYAEIGVLRASSRPQARRGETRDLVAEAEPGLDETGRGERAGCCLADIFGAGSFLSRWVRNVGHTQNWVLKRNLSSP